MKPNRTTGAVILGIIAAIFGIDSFLATQNHMTISEWFYDFLHNDPVTGFGLLALFFVVFIVHVWYFRPLKD